MIEICLNPIGHVGADGFVELFLYLGFVVLNRELTPIEGVLASQYKARGSLDGAGVVDCEIRNTVESRSGISAHGRSACVRPAIGKPKTRCEAMLPMKQPERTHLLAWIEVNILAVENDIHDVVVELAECEVARIKHRPVAIDDLHGVNVQPGRSRESEVQKSDIV